MKILVADDSETNLMMLTAALEKLGHSVAAFTSGEALLENYPYEHPDLVILDVSMAGMSGFECAKKLRERNAEEWIPIIFLSANDSDESISQGIDAGGDDYLLKPFSHVTLAAKIKAMQRISDMRKKLYETSQKLDRLSKTDPLTGIYNRLQFNKVISSEMQSADQSNHLIALLFIDLDNFKIINDTYGHHFGDLLLIEVSKRLSSCLRTTDFIARVGGDEFAIIITKLDDVKDAGIVAQKIIDKVSEPYYIENQVIHTGASIGIACYPTPKTTRENFLQNADKAMYQAKELGRNRYHYF